MSDTTPRPDETPGDPTAPAQPADVEVTEVVPTTADAVPTAEEVAAPARPVPEQPAPPVAPPAPQPAYAQATPEPPPYRSPSTPSPDTRSRSCRRRPIPVPPPAPPSPPPNPMSPSDERTAGLRPTAWPWPRPCCPAACSASSPPWSCT